MRNALLLLISCAFSLALIEGLAFFWLNQLASQDQFRLYGTLQQNQERFEQSGQSFSKYAPHRYIGFVPSPGYKRGNNYHNSQSYRGDPISSPKAKNEFRIFCMGGSTTYTSFVDSPSQAYPAVMERALREAGYDYVRVINAGAEGWTTYETLINYQLRVSDLSPDMIVVYQGVNDAIARLIVPSTAYKGDNSGYAQHVAPNGARLPLLERSTIVRMLMTQFGDRTSPLELRGTLAGLVPTAVFWDYTAQIGMGTYPSGVFEDHPVESIFESNKPIYFRRNVENLIAASTREGVITVLATFALSPNYRTASGDDALILGLVAGATSTPAFVAAIKEQNEIILELGERDEIHVFDFAAKFPHEGDLFVDPVHVSEAGAQVKGEMFAQYLSGEGLIPQRQ